MNAHFSLESPPLLREDRGPVVVLTLNRAAARNALSDAMISALDGELASVAEDPRVRAVVIASHGPAFCAGHDLKEVTLRRADTDRGRAAFANLFERCSAAMMRIVRLPQPVIAAVEGVATAAGCQLVASCDLAVAGADARFATPGVNIGLFCSTPMVALTRNVPRKHAMEMLLFGDLIDAAEAHRLGLVNRVVPAGSALEEAIALAGRIAGKSAATLRIGKRAFYEQAEMSLEDAYTHTGRVMIENMLARDAEEGIAAFVEKRAPVWQDAEG